MRKQQKKIAEDFIRKLFVAQMELKQLVKKCDFDRGVELLQQCQQDAIELGTLIEDSEGEGFITVTMLEDYCELAYSAYERLTSERNLGQDMQDKLQQMLLQIKYSVREDIRERMEIVFLPYKVSMWDSLESVWKAADQDPSCDPYVIPIPYYDQTPDGRNGEMHYEGDQYPDYVPITRYDAYDFVKRHPDMIFIHNPYDEYNRVTGVDAFFFSKNLKQYTEMLVYIPYFVLGDISSDDKKMMEKVRNYCVTPGVLNANRVIVESEQMRKFYVDILTETIGEETKEKWDTQILGLGSPKIDKIRNMRKEMIDIPGEWMKIIKKADGSRKKVILYNTSIGALLEADQIMLIKKMQETLQTFRSRRSEVALLWRPHPLIPATIQSMRPQIWKEYKRLIDEYRTEEWGIYDDTGDVDRAVTLCDAYYGDPSSVIPLCQQLGKPIMIQRIPSAEE